MADTVQTPTEIETGHGAEYQATTEQAAHDAYHHAGPFSIESADFWYFIAFVAFVVLLGKPLFGFITGMLDKRAEGISASIDEARALREEAQELLATYKRKQRDALEEAEDLLAETKAQAKGLKDAATKDLEQALKQRQDQAMQKIALAEREAIYQVQSAAADIAVAAARELIQDKLSDAAATKVTEQAIKDLPKHLN